MFKQHLTELTEDLKNFGLKPSEWSLQTFKKHVYVVHRKDKDLTLYGQVGVNIASGKLALKNLTLIGV
jgi:hypothetical protein